MNFKEIIGPDELDWKVIPLDWKKIGKEELKLGTPMSKDGVEANDASCYGILMDDVQKDKHFQARVIVSGCVDFAKAEEYSGIKISAEAKKAIGKVWSQGGGGSGPIDPKRLPEGYPYKEGSKTVIEWNGNTAGHEQATFDIEMPGYAYVHVSDIIPTAEDLQGAQCVFNQGGEVETLPVSGVEDKGNVIITDLLFVAKEACDFYHENGFTITFPVAGIYFSSVEGAYYLSELTYGTETIHPMAPEFLPALTSPNGTKYQLTVADDGTLSAVVVS